jgi:hypothetical protein
MGAVLGLSYLAGFVITWVVLYQRAGFPAVPADWREFLIPNLFWFVLFVFKFWFWPATLVVWLIEGRPPSRWRAVTELEGRPARKIVRVTTPPAAAGSYNKL